jgi:hypothetical protein
VTAVVSPWMLSILGAHECRALRKSCATVIGGNNTRFIAYRSQNESTFTTGVFAVCNSSGSSSLWYHSRLILSRREGNDLDRLLSNLFNLTDSPAPICKIHSLSLRLRLCHRPLHFLFSLEPFPPHLIPPPFASLTCPGPFYHRSDLTVSS